MRLATDIIVHSTLTGSSVIENADDDADDQVEQRLAREEKDEEDGTGEAAGELGAEDGAEQLGAQHEGVPAERDAPDGRW